MLFRSIRAFGRGSLIPNIDVYVGDVPHLLAGGPTPFPDSAGFTTVSQQLWTRLQHKMGPDAVVLLLKSYDQKGYAKLRGQGIGTSLGDGVLLVQGPQPPAGFGPAPHLDPPSLGLLARNTALAFLVLLLVGIGWSTALLPGLDLIERVALAPAFGMSTLVAVGAEAGLLGAIVSGVLGLVLAVLVALAGWGVAVLRRLRRPPTDPTTEPASDPNAGPTSGEAFEPAV